MTWPRLAPWDYNHWDGVYEGDCNNGPRPYSPLREIPRPPTGSSSHYKLG